MVALVVWALAEAAFYVYGRRRQARLQRPVVASSLSPAERTDLFRHCMDATTDLPTFLRGWFLGAPLTSLRRGNLEQWLAWAFFGRKWADLSEDDKSEVAARVQEIEDRLERTLPPGYNPAVRSIRVTLDRPMVMHRPLVYYATLRALDYGAHTILRSRGFERHRSGRLVYWYWPGRGEGKDRMPTVFLHGIGIGLAAYLAFVSALEELDHPIILVELRHIASRVCDDFPSIEEMVEGLEAALRRHHHRAAVFAGHSMGTGTWWRTRGRRAMSVRTPVL